MVLLLHLHYMSINEGSVPSCALHEGNVFNWNFWFAYKQVKFDVFSNIFEFSLLLWSYTYWLSDKKGDRNAST